jgi:hypothetical protein
MAAGISAALPVWHGGRHGRVSRCPWPTTDHGLGAPFRVVRRLLWFTSMHPALRRHISPPERHFLHFFAVGVLAGVFGLGVLATVLLGSAA